MIHDKEEDLKSKLKAIEEEKHNIEEDLKAIEKEKLEIIEDLDIETQRDVKYYPFCWGG